jgi:hypothetical protein
MYADLKAFVAYATQTVSATVSNITGVDTQDYRALCFLITTAAFSFTGTNKITITLEESNNSDMSSSNVVAAADIWQPENGTIAKVLDATADGAAVHAIHYLGSKRYVRPVLTVGGTVSVALGVTALKGKAQFQPPL